MYVSKRGPIDWSKYTLVDGGRPDFLTHLIYAERLNKLSSALLLESKINPTLTKNKLGDIEQKLNLVTLIKKSLKDELRIVNMDREYSASSVLWLPTKTYYSLYHLLSIIDYLLTGNTNSLRISHQRCSSVFTDRLIKKQISFSEERFNEVYDKRILAFKIRSGENLSRKSSDDLIWNLIMKKVGKYKLEDHKIKERINQRTKIGREKLEKYLSNKFKVSIFDFFYLMRVKSTYRDFNFIADIPSSDTERYFKEYYSASNNFFTCFDNLRKELITNIH